MIKKAAHIILISLFLVTTIGVTINKHYSHGKLFSVAMFVDAKTCCEGSESCGCCSEEIEIHQLKLDYLISNFNTQEVQEIDLLFTNLFFNFTIHTFVEEENSTNYILSKFLPPKVENPLSLLQVFRV